MKVCVNCFKDIDIIKRIRDINHKDICDIHNKIDYIYDTNSDIGLKDNFVDLLSIYKKDVDNKYRNSVHLTNIYNSLEKDWNIFAINAAEIQKFLTALFDNKVPAPLISIIPQLVSEEEKCRRSMLGNHSWKDFCNDIKNRNRFYNNYFRPDIFLKFLEWTKITIKKGTVFYRSRIDHDNKRKSYQSKDMKIPPKNLVSAGRLNSNGIGALYLSNDKLLTIAEIRPAVGDVVVTGKFTLKKDLEIVDLTKLDNISVFGSSMDPEFLIDYQINRDILNSICEDMRKPSGSQYNSLDYLPTQYISDVIKSQYRGIKYGSSMTSKENQNYNLVVFDDEDVEVDINHLSFNKIKSVNYDPIRI